MKTSDFYYDLPKELIAQTPIEKRDASRLMTLERTTGAVEHHHFYELPDFLNPGDCLILNDSRVLPARLLGQPAGRHAAAAGRCVVSGAGRLRPLRRAHRQHRHRQLHPQISESLTI